MNPAVLDLQSHVGRLVKLTALAWQCMSLTVPRTRSHWSASWSTICEGIRDVDLDSMERLQQRRMGRSPLVFEEWKHDLLSMW